MILAELSIVLISIAGFYGISRIAKKLKFKLSKKKLKKMLNKGFELMDTDMIKNAISSLIDFDSKYNSKKLNKYLLEIIKVFRDDPKKLNLNEVNVLNLAKEFVFDNIFDADEQEESRQLDTIEEKLEETREVLTEVEKRRQEILLRKNQIRQRQSIKSNKRRQTGSLG